MFLLLALIGCPTSTTPDPVCESGDEFPTCEVADACREADTATRADCEQRLSWSDACSADWRSSAGGATQTVLPGSSVPTGSNGSSSTSSTVRNGTASSGSGRGGSTSTTSTPRRSSTTVVTGIND